jgi:hypothetical protein
LDLEGRKPMKINKEKNKARIERIAQKKEKRDKQKADYELKKKAAKSPCKMGKQQGLGL